MVRQLTNRMEVMWNYNQGKMEKQGKNPAAFWFLSYRKNEFWIDDVNLENQFLRST